MTAVRVLLQQYIHVSALELGQYTLSSNRSSNVHPVHEAPLAVVTGTEGTSKTTFCGHLVEG